MYRTAIVDELGTIRFWVDALQDEKQVEHLLVSHPEWERRCICVE